MAASFRLAAVLLPVAVAVMLSGPSSAAAAKDDVTDPEKAIKKYGRAVKKAPEDPDNWYKLGLAHVLLEHWDDALAAVDEALRLAPEHVRAEHVRGKALLGAGRAEEAVAAFRKAVELDPGFLAAQADLASALHGAGHYEEAINAYKDALRTKPENPSPFYTSIGDAYFKLGDMDQATRWFERTLELAPDDPVTHFNLGALYKKLSLQDPQYAQKAADAFVRAADLDPKDPQAQFLAGENLYNVKRYADAKGYFERCLRLSPSPDVERFAELYLAEVEKELAKGS